ncbi:MAG TPA: hypothetical protein PLD88_08340, partial [Candidatus Berkiella sp.]|nr:hypothetical protein [Candidatus Berkiella sp.]
TELRVIDTNTTIGSDPYDADAIEDLYAMHGHGTSELFSFLMKKIIKTPHDVVIASTPTYGLFIEPLSQTKANLVTFSLTQKDNYKPTPKQLRELIVRTNDALLNNYKETITVTKKVLSVL